MERKGRIEVMVLPDDSMSTEIDREFIRRTYDIARSAVLRVTIHLALYWFTGERTLLNLKMPCSPPTDVTRHAETGLAALATQRFSSDTLLESTLYTSTECCIMCCGATHWAGIPKLVFGVTASRARRVRGGNTMASPAENSFSESTQRCSWWVR